MTGGEVAYLSLAIGAFLVFTAFVMWATHRTNPERPEFARDAEESAPPPELKKAA